MWKVDPFNPGVADKPALRALTNHIVSIVQEGESTSAAVTFFEICLAGGSASVGCSDVMFTNHLHPPPVIEEI